VWNKALIAKGFEYISQSSEGSEISKYHLEAGIAAYHSSAKNFGETDWENILQLYEMLERINPSPLTLLNKAIVLAQLNGSREALEEVLKIKNLDKYYLYHTTLAELYKQQNQTEKAKKHLETALGLTDSAAEISLIKSKIGEMEITK